ncbi:MAG TPA: efflux RND transporter periplasmic adaptor subunit, partial [Candidatus Kapabacteria bacterium]|nr:efflux RND transporter periplasmic adaptor subunit [Candidatus Kapabacteria bacterium]
AKVTGIKETMQQAAIEDKIVKINAKVGSRVSEGQVIVEFPKDNPRIQYDQAKVGYENAKKLYERMKQLLAAGETSQQNFDNAEAQFLVAKRNWESINKLINIESPISGTITQMLVKEGDKVKAGDNLFTVAQLNKVKAKVWASLIEVQYIKPGMDATMKINGDVYTGKVSVVDLSIDPKHNAYGVEIVFDNYHGKIRSGVTADIRINAYKRNNAIVVPRRYIVFDGDEKFVFVEKDGKAYKQTVKTGIESSIDIEITEGLNPGDRLITDGIFLLRNGSKVKIVN